jgi:hypothetical protein
MFHIMGFLLLLIFVFEIINSGSATLCIEFKIKFDTKT